MNEDTKNLLKECSSGCKMAIDSVKQVMEYAEDSRQKAILEGYLRKHEELEKECGEMLNEAGKEEKAPGIMASAFSWATTEMKMMMKKDRHQIAKLMMDGSNMGIQSVCEYQNKYTQASREAIGLARKLVKVEEDFMQEMKQFL